ncbi:MAG: SdrD B-like domain-containing protein [Clostridia bacterium]
MSKIRKIAVSIIIGIITVFGIYSVSNAYSVGQSITITYNQYAGSSNIFCVEHGQALTADNSYKIISNVKIEGIKSTDYKNKTIEDKSNAKFAYILSANNGSSHDSGPVQNEIWNYGYTWMKNVGQYHNGLNLNFVSAVPGNSSQSTTTLDAEATNYANNISNGTKVTDNTDKSKIKVEAYNKDGTQYMRVGPFNWTFGGKLTEVSIYDQNSKPIAGKLYSTFSGKTEKWINVGEIKSGSDFYISVPVNSGATKITKVTGKMDIEVKAVNIWFLESTTSYKQNLIIREPYNATETIDLSFDYNISILGNLKVIKVNKDNTKVKLPNVGFKIQNKDTKKWVKETNGTISYVDNKEQATEFITDKNGEITIKNLIVGTYVAYETKNPNYGYEIIEDGKEKNVTVDKTAELQIPNKQKYIKLSGYVWVDRYSGKQSARNDLYKNGTYDSEDILLDGITVRLKDESGNVIKEAKTANGGAYLFTDVLVDDLDKYYIEFEYDGLIYTNVISHIDKDNGSKSAESSTTRENFNKGFSSVVGGETSNTGATLDENGKKKNDLTYNLTYDAENGAKSTLVNNGLYPITANTDETGYSIKAHFTPGQEEIKYINLGLYEREQPDISLVKDLLNVKVSINGYNHVYEYNQRFDKAIEPTEDDLNVGIKYKNKFTGSYNRAIYEADYNYTSADVTNELEVYVTYQLRMNNESSSLTTQINSIVDYYDSNYTLCGVGTSLNNDTMDVQKNIDYGVLDYNENYNKLTINNNTKVDAGKYADIYVQFKLNRQAVINIINNKENLDNVAEINSYSVFDTNGNIYAGIDKDSNPGNANPADVTTHQDDTSSAPGLLLEVADAREMTGKVFLDYTSNELKTGEIRQGDGEYKEGELGISGVKVTLTENKENGQMYTATTDENGDFYISGYIPGDYTLTYTWGDETYTVQNYKGTIYKDKDRANNKEWYKTTEPRYSDAIDDYTLRQNIDNETKNITGATKTTIDKMNSTTPTMGIGVEYDTTTTASTGDRYTYRISNIDFGIVERARQEIDINKRVSGFKVTLANGQVVADVTIDENGNMTGEKDHVTYMGPSANNGFVKLELDNELIQGATVQVEYTIVVKNNSELDYNTKDYYLYGIPGTEDDIICIKPEGVYDYLDSEMALDTTKDNSNWSVVSREEYNNRYEYPDKETIVESYFNDSKTTVTDEEGNTIVTYKWEKGGSETSNETFFVEEWATQVTETRTIRDVKLDNKTILHNVDLEKELAPGEESRDSNGDSVKLYASKVLANTDEIDLNNDAEITEVRREKDTGRIVTPTSASSSFYTRGETVIVTPPTGQDQNYIAIVATVVSALVILGAGVVLIRKKILGDK